VILDRPKAPVSKALVFPLLVGLWLAFLASAIWLRALHSVQPPLYDAQSYIAKALLFWQAVGRGEWIAALKVEPAVRPLGTVLLTAPFGFSPEYTAFHFRSVFLPITFAAMAVYVAAGRAAARQFPQVIACCALVVSSLPMFYHLDWVDDMPGTSGWGLVDNFQAGIAALATAFMIASVRQHSVVRFVIASTLAAYSALVKPSGMMVIALMGAAWVLLLVFDRSPGRRQGRPAWYAVRCGVAAAMIGTGLLAYCFWSGYFSTQSFAFAQQNLAVMKRELHVELRQLVELMNAASGIWLPLFVAGIAAVQALSAFRGQTRASAAGPAWPLWTCVATMWVGGAWYWLVVQSGGSQIRYFHPFLLMGAMFVVPLAHDAWWLASRAGRAVLVLLCVLPAINLAGLLSAGDEPSVAWQKRSGVTVAVGGDVEEVIEARRFIEALRASGISARLYSFSGFLPLAAFENVGLYERMVHPDAASFSVSHPYDWIAGFAVRTEDLASATHILLHKYGPETAQRLAFASRVPSFDQEKVAFQVWLSTQGFPSGLETVWDGRRTRLLAIANREAFRKAVEQFVSTHQWRPEFLQANAAAWWNGGARTPAVGTPAITNVDFEGIYRLDALSMHREGSNLKVDVAWEELRAMPENASRYLFLHLLDASGAIIQNQQIALYPYDPPAGSRARYGTVTFARSDDARIVALGFGVYHSNGSLLRPGHGLTDWGGRRLVLPLPPLKP
jgi:hypothetical protein